MFMRKNQFQKYGMITMINFDAFLDWLYYWLILLGKILMVLLFTNYIIIILIALYIIAKIVIWYHKIWKKKKEEKKEKRPSYEELLHKLNECEKQNNEANKYGGR